MSTTPEIDGLFRAAANCNACFDTGGLRRSFIDVANPRRIGPGYGNADTRILVLMINPGKGFDDERHREQARLIRAFGAGEDTLGTLFQIQKDDFQNWGGGRFLSYYAGTLGLDIDAIAIANVAWCSARDDRYPGFMLNKCFDRRRFRSSACSILAASSSAGQPCVSWRNASVKRSRLLASVWRRITHTEKALPMKRQRLG